MPRDTPRWVIPATIATALFFLAIAVDFIVRHPGVFIILVLGVYVFSRPHLPWCYTSDELARYPGSIVASELVRLWLPLLHLFGLVYGTVYVVMHGITGSMLLVLFVTYFGDWLVAWTIRRAVAWWQVRARRRREAAVRVPVGVNEDGEVVDGEVVK